MKTQIIHIDPHDDHSSLRDKLLWSKSPRVILVWPGRVDILNTRLDLKLLKRLAQQQGMALGLLTYDPQVRAHAKDLSIPIFGELEKINEADWGIWQPDEIPGDDSDSAGIGERPQQQVSSLPSPRSPLLRFLVLLFPIGAFLLALALLLPSARIELHPNTLRELETLQLLLEGDSNSDVARLPYESVQREVSGTYRLPTTGSRQSPVEEASGEVTFTNQSSESVLIPAGTTLRASSNPSLIFLTERDVLLEGGEGEQINVSVKASEPGPQGNLSAASIDRIDGPLGLSLNVTNQEPLSGGSSRTRAAVSAADIREIKQILETQLRDAYFEMMADILPPDQLILQSTFRTVETIQEEYDAVPGDIADSIGLNLTQVFEAAVIQRYDLEQLARRQFEDDLPPGYTFTSGSPSLLQIREMEGRQVGDVLIEADFSIESSPVLDVKSILDAGLGSSVESFERFLATTSPGNLSPVVTLSPSWWPRLPLFAYQIQIEVSPEVLP